MSLSPTDVQKLSTAQHVLLRPLTAASAEAWLHDAADALRDLFEAEQVVLTVAGPGEEVVVASDVGPSALAEYEARFAADDLAGEVVTARPSPFYTQADVAGLPLFQAHLRSAAYNEWYRPHDLTRALGMFVSERRARVPSLYAPCVTPVVANALVAGSPLAVDAGAEKGRALLRLIEPVFRAGVLGHLAWRQHLEQMVGSLDRLRRPLAVVSLDGHVLHLTPSASALLDEAPDEGVSDAVMGVVEEVRAIRTAAAGGQTGSAVREVVTRSGVLWVHGCLYDGEAFGREAAVLVGLESSPPLPSATALTDAWHLTRRQAEVALLLARRYTDGEIASTLGISPYTARHHTEAVLSRLDLRDRRQLASLLVGAASDSTLHAALGAARA